MNINNKSLIFWGLGALLFAGALIWAKSDDPFRRIEFSVNTSDAKTRGIIVLPKLEQKRPVILYLHGMGGSYLTDGRELRQWAELGFAVVGFDYNQTNYPQFERQFSAVLEHVRQQPWAMADHMAWIGYSQGAQYSLEYLLRHPAAHPQLMVRMSGGWIDALSEMTGGGTNSGQLEISDLRFQTLLVHGERDDIFPTDDVRKLAGLLASNGVPVDLKILPGVGHTFGIERLAVIRVIGEYCKVHLIPDHPQPEFTQLCPIPFLVCSLPAFFWLGAWYYSSRRGQKTTDGPRLTKLAIGLRAVTVVLTILALMQVALHLVLPRMEINATTLKIARNHLVPSQWKDDFESMASRPLWKGQKLETLLTHVELANYTVYELVKWKPDEQIYRDFVLSPAIDPDSDIELAWRRPLWEFYYPRIRGEQTAKGAAGVVACALRERVTIWPGGETKSPNPKNWPRGIQTIWDRQITDQEGFQLIYVATLRSVGVPARLNSFHQTEYWDEGQWRAAPRPPLNTWRDLNVPVQVPNLATGRP